MMRIEDLSGFHAVRERGLAKLLPAVPRITVGKGTCRRGNQAEGVYQPLAQVIDRAGLDILGSAMRPTISVSHSRPRLRRA